jgi:hypothetical protein
MNNNLKHTTSLTQISLPPEDGFERKEKCAKLTIFNEFGPIEESNAICEEEMIEEMEPIALKQGTTKRVLPSKPNPQKVINKGPTLGRKISVTPKSDAQILQNKDRIKHDIS